ncbi:MAG TPA: hypothetical protein VH913_14190 [Hyphomicrobiaceae bacterium]|jgi:hypothetical protein
MPFPIITKLVALLNAITQTDIEALPPARREQLGQLLKFWGARCDPPNGVPKTGVVSNLTRKPRDD